MFELSGIAPFDVTQWGVGVHDADITQVLQSHEILGLPKPIQPSAAECQRTEVLIYDV